MRKRKADKKPAVGTEIVRWQISPYEWGAFVDRKKSFFDRFYPIYLWASLVFVILSMGALAIALWFEGATLGMTGAVMGAAFLFLLAAYLVIRWKVRNYWQRVRSTNVVEVRVGEDAAVVGDELVDWSDLLIDSVELVQGSPPCLKINVSRPGSASHQTHGIPFPAGEESEAQQVLERLENRALEGDTRRRSLPSVPAMVGVACFAVLVAGAICLQVFYLQMEIEKGDLVMPLIGLFLLSIPLFVWWRIEELLSL